MWEGFVEGVGGIGEGAVAYRRFEGGKVCFDPWR